jgi:hypothetical protein
MERSTEEPSGERKSQTEQGARLSAERRRGEEEASSSMAGGQMSLTIEVYLRRTGGRGFDLLAPQSIVSTRLNDGATTVVKRCGHFGRLMSTCGCRLRRRALVVEEEVW